MFASYEDVNLPSLKWIVWLYDGIDYAVVKRSNWFVSTVVLEREMEEEKEAAK